MKTFRVFACWLLLITLTTPVSVRADMTFPILETLPDPFASSNGQRVQTPDDWRRRRDEIKTLLAFYEYGHLPPATSVRLLQTTNLSDENGTHREHLLIGCGPNDNVQFTLDLHIPSGNTGPFPVVLTGDALAPPNDEVNARGYIVAHFDRSAFAPDDASRKGGIYALYPDTDCGTLGGWAWGYARVIDYLATRCDVKADQIAVVGHSRGGKAALIAGAFDERIALTVSAQSGTGGASPFRLQGKNSESLAQATARFNHWFGPHLQRFAGREAQLPFDQHFLLALIAPRNLLLLNAFDDPYSNLDAANQTFRASREVFDFLGARNNVGLHLRAGKHSFDAADWRALLDFADRQFEGRKTATGFDGTEPQTTNYWFDWRAPHH